MAYWLFPILALSLAYLGYFALRAGGASRTLPGGATAGDVDKAVTLSYLLICTGAIAGLLISHLAMPGPTVARAARHIEFRGVAVTVPSVTGDMSDVRISGDAVNAESEVQRGFRWAALPSGAIIDLRPDRIDGEHIASYRALGRHLSQIARINGSCINAVVGGWIEPGERGLFAFGSNAHSKSVALGVYVADDRVQVDVNGNRTKPMPIRAAETLRALFRRAERPDLASFLLGWTDSKGTPALDAVTIVDRRPSDELHSLGVLAGPEAGTEDDGFNVERVDDHKNQPSPDIPASKGQFALLIQGDEGASRLILPGAIENTTGGQVRLKFLFDPPRAYPLPPVELLNKLGGKIALTSSTIGPNADGYTFDTGNLNETYTTFAQLAPDGTQLNLATEREGQDRHVDPNQDRLLGDGSVVPVYALVDPLKGKQGVVLAPLGSIFLGLAFCIFGFVTIKPRKGGVKRLPRDLAQSHAAFPVWVVAVTLLAVRAVLAFRVSLLPPFNMDANSIGSFRACWPRAWSAILDIPPLLGLLVFVAVRAKGVNALPSWTQSIGRVSQRGLTALSDRPWLRLGHIAYTLAFAVAAAAFLHKYLHLPLPEYALTAIMLVVLGLVCEGVSQARDGDFGNSADTVETRLKTWLAGKPPVLMAVASAFARRGWPLLATSVLTLAVDPGTFIFFIPLAVAVAVGAVSAGFGKSRRNPAESRSPGAKPAIGALAAFCVVGVLFAVPIGTRLLTNSLIGHVVRGSSFPYRLVAMDAPSAEHLLVDTNTRFGVFNAIEMEDTLHQRWEMLTYVKAAPTGYFQAPLSNVGMTYPTMVSDAVFSIFLVGEHGKAAGLLTIALILTLAFAVYRTAWAASRSRAQRANARGLYVLASVFGGAALYMGLANLWVVPFTGQNLPFLSLESREDLVLNTTLVIAALLLIAFPSGTGAQIDREAASDARRQWWLWWAFPMALGCGWVYLAVAMARTAGDPLQPYNLRPDTLAAIQDRVSRAAAESAGGRLPLLDTAAVNGSPTFVRSMFQAFEQGAVSRTPFVSERGGAHLTLDKAFFLVQSPFNHDQGVAWHGSLLAQGMVLRRQLIIGGSRVPVILEPGAGVAEITLGVPFGSIRAQTIEIRQQFGRGRSVDYGGVTLNGDDVVIRWRTAGKPGAILINGERPQQKLNEHVLQPSDRVSLEYTGADGVAQKLSIQYPGPSEAALAQVAWRNGRYLRTFPQGSDFPLAYTIGQIADADVRNGAKLKDVTLSMDLPLQRDLQDLLRSWGREKSRLINSGAKAPDGLPFTAVTVLDSGTGAIRALAAIPQCDPADSPASIRSRFPSERDALVASQSSWAFVNRTIGSTIKPLTYSALSTQLNHGGFDLGSLHVDEQSALESESDPDGTTHWAYRKLGDIELKRGKRLGAHEHARPDVDMVTYLRDSRTWPAIVTSTIGLVSDKSEEKLQKQELREMFSPGGSDPLTLGGHRVSFQPRLALHRLFAPDGSLSSLELDDTAYFRGIQSCFGPGVAPFNTDGAERWDDGLDKSFYFPLDLTLAGTELRTLGLPDVHRTDTTNLTDLDTQLVRYMIGSGECRWNAVTMAANAARIMTGMKVQPNLSCAAKAAKDPMPAPISNFAAWRRARILEPLMQISTIPSEYLVKIHAALPSGYRIAMKTGTIDDGSAQGAMESEMLMFTVGPYSDTSGFVADKCLSGFLSIRSSKKAEGDDMIKGDLAARVIPILVAHLKSESR